MPMKKEKKIHLLTTLVMALVLMIYSNAPIFASENKTIVVDGEVFAASRDCKGEGWAYDSENRVLSLDGYNGMYIDLGTQENVVVEVSGTNKAVSAIEAPAIRVSGSLTVKGQGKLELAASACHAALYAQGGELSISETDISVEGTGATQNTEYLVMADGPIKIESSTINIQDKVETSGGAIGNTTGNISITDSKITIDSSGKALVSIDGSVTVSGSSSELVLTSRETAIYGKKGIRLDMNSKTTASSKDTEGTTVFSPEGDIEINSADVKITSGKTAIAGRYIFLTGAYLADPFDGEINEVSSMQTVCFENAVCGNVQFLSGPRPTATPTPTPTPIPPTPTPTPSPETGIGDFFDSIFTPRMFIGGLLVVAGFVVIMILIISKIRNRNNY